MNTVRRHLGNILENLDRAAALQDLNPKENGSYVYLDCPSCGQHTAYISKQGYYIYCNRKNSCSHVRSLLDHVIERDGLTEEDAIRQLATLSHTELPELSEEEKKEYRELRARESLLADILEFGRRNIWYKDSDKAKEYLKGRGYNDDEILTMEFGYIPLVKNLEKYLKKKEHNAYLIEKALESFKQDSHSLWLPIYNPSGHLDGFVARAVNLTNDTPKYVYSKGLERGAYFFNFNKVKKAKTLIIVEGMIDALLLTQRDISGVVACGGDSPTLSQIENAFKYGKFKNVILCLDNDDAGQKGTAKAIELLKDKGVNIYVANTDPYKDPDELLKNTNLSELIDRLKNAESWEKWSAKRIISQYDITTDIGKKDALDELLELENGINDPIKSDNIISYITERLGYSKESVQDKLLSFHEKRAKEKEAESYKELVKGAYKLQSEGKFDELGKFLSEGISKARALVASKIVTPYSIEKALEDVRRRQEGLATGYPSLDNYLSIPNGAITLVAARPSHRKTTFLLNLMLNMVEHNPAKSFYFFSYEESKTALFVKMVNILAKGIISEKFQNQNTTQIERCIKFRHIEGRPKIKEAFTQYAGYVEEKRLWLIDEPLSVESLAGTIEQLSFNNNVGAVFIDYAQRIKYDGKYDNERVKIARISETLRETATRLDLPLIVGAQLNRDAAKGKPQLENLKEAGNLEEDANVVLGLYNWKTALDKEKAEEATNGNGKNNNCNGEPVSVDERSIDFEVHILKNRNGAINNAALLKFDAPLLRITDSKPNPTNN